MTDLNHAPPRLSDLKGDDLTAALTARHERHKANWERSREHRPLARRLVERIFG